MKMKGLEQEGFSDAPLSTKSTLDQLCQESAERDMNALAMARSYSFRAERSQVRQSNHGDNNNSICICPEMTGQCERNHIKSKRTQIK